MDGGIDEAGRGPVLGPLIVAGVAADPEVLRSMGCKDSKQLSPAKRAHIARLLASHEAVHVEIRPIDAATLDAERATTSLNDIELARFCDIAARLAEAGATKITVDAADVNAARFGAKVQEATQVPIHSMHRADATDVATAAASIVAKVARDAAIEELARRHERRIGLPMGSGYPSDPATKAFLAAWVERFGDVPEGARRSWKTVTALLAPKQSSLSGWENP